VAKNNVQGRSLLILRPDHLGDLVLFSGALKLIRQQWPDACITLCVRKYGAELFRHCPHIDEIIPYEKLHDDALGQGRLLWMPKIRGSDRLGCFVRRYFRGLLRQKYGADNVILPLLAPVEEYHRCVDFIPARTKVGVGGNLCNQSVEVDKAFGGIYSARMDASELPWNFPEMEATQRFLRFIGVQADSGGLWPEFWTTQEDGVKADRLMPKKSSGIILGIAPGVTSFPGKRLPLDWYMEVISSLDWSDAQIVLLGSPTDLSECEAVARAIENTGRGKCAVNLAGKTSVREMVECIKRCDILLSQETAAVHIGTALRVPTVGIVGGGHFGRFYPWGSSKLSRAVHKPMDCYGCNWRCKFETVRCIQEITVTEAVQALNALAAPLFAGGTTHSTVM
jgi:ADP-heptose:LPS heptosyltransferase